MLIAYLIITAQPERTLGPHINRAALYPSPPTFCGVALKSPLNVTAEIHRQAEKRPFQSITIQIFEFK